MSKQAFKRLRRVLSMPVNREPLPCFAWPGGYLIVYHFTDGGSICADCVNKEITLIDESNRWNHDGWAVNAFSVVGSDCDEEDVGVICDNCGKHCDPVERTRETQV